MSQQRRLLSTLVVLALSATGAAQAAKPATTGPASTGSASTGSSTSGLWSCSVTADVSVAADACAGFFGSNDQPAIVASVIASAGWTGLGTLTQYKDTNLAAGSTIALFDLVKSGTDASQGQLSLLQNLGGPFVLTIKGGSNFAAYRFDHGLIAGSLLSVDVPGMNQNGLSHVSIYANAGSITSAVPEPGSYALMLAGLGGLGFLARRRSL